MWIASDGQASTQVWQSTHISLSTFALSFSMAIADAGHSLTQVSHPVHLSLSTTATNSFTPVNMFILLVKKGLLFCCMIQWRGITRNGYRYLVMIHVSNGGNVKKIRGSFGYMDS